jgi:hypothetical protein
MHLKTRLGDGIMLCLMILLASGCAARAQERPLARVVSLGDTFVYSRTMQSGIAKQQSTLTLSVSKLTNDGYESEVLFTNGKNQETAHVVANLSGWTRSDGHGHVRPHDFVTYDPAAYCALPQMALAGSSWSCHISPVGIFPDGDVIVKILSKTSRDLKLGVSGKMTPGMSTQTDGDTGKPIQVATSGEWSTQAWFHDGILQSEMTTFHTVYNVAGSNIPQTSTVKLMLQSIHRSQ